jgi:hypothetical protein
MKKMKRIFVFSILLGGASLLFNCQDNSFEEIELESQEKFQRKGKSEKFINYKGLRVKQRFSGYTFFNFFKKLLPCSYCII